MQRKFLFILLLLFVCTLSFIMKGNCQISSHAKKEVQKLLKNGDKYDAEEDHHKALDAYTQVLKIDPKNTKALFRTGITNLLIYNNRKSLELLLLYGQSDVVSALDKHYYYWLGRAYQANAQFERAEETYKQYLDILPKGDSRQEEVQQLILQSQSGKAFVEDAVDYYAFSLGYPLNSRYSDHSPMLTNNRQTLIYTSRRTENKKGEEITPKGDAFENIYISNLINGNWEKPKPFEGGFTNKKQHTSNVQLFDDGTKMLIYKSVNFGSLFIAEKRNGKWSKPRKFSKYTSTGKFIPNGYITKDGKVIYFASSQGSRNGTLDLFVSYLTADSTWSEPERLPGTINSSLDEDAPYVSDDGKSLYFSSRGHDSMGGYDVFKTTYDPVSRLWNKPVNMGYPVNSPSDDIYFIPDTSDKEYFVASNREGTVGQEDIFVIRLFADMLVKGTITDSSSGKPLPGYSINFVAVKKPERKVAAVTDSSSNYSFRLRSNYTYKVEISNPEGNVLLLDEVTLPLAYNDSSEIVQNFRVKLPSAAPVASNTGIKIENVNLIKLHYQPSDSLIITGVISDREGVIPEAQIQLRAEENKEIIYTTTSDAEGKYSIAIMPGYKTDYVIEITKPGYLLNSIAVLYIDQPGFKANELDPVSVAENSLQINTQLAAVETGSKQVLGGIYFDFNRSALIPESAIVLDKLYTFLQANPAIRLQISGYTDNINTPVINRLISQRRAKAVADYLIKKGIRSNRLETVGYGDTQPVTSNERSINGQDVNRRVEIKILNK